MALLLVILFVIAPIVEIYVLLTAGSIFGPLPVIAACIGTAILGGVLIRIQGLRALNAARQDLNNGRPPVESAVDGALLVVAAPFLMTPGFVTDAVGFALLLPPVRRWLGVQALAMIRRRIERGDARVTIIER